MSKMWMNRKTKDKHKVAYFLKNGIKPYREENGTYYFNAQETEIFNIAYNALERGK